MVEPPGSLAPGELIQRAVGLYRGHVLLFAGILAGPSVLTAAAGSLVTRRLPDVRNGGIPPEEAMRLIAPLLGAFAIFWGISVIAGVAGLGATVHAVDTVRSGRRPGIPGAWSSVARQGPAVVLLAVCLVIVSLAGVGGGAVVALIAGAGLALVHPVLGIVALPILVAAAAVTGYTMLRLSLAPAIVALDGRGPLASLGRSVALTRGRVLPLAVTLLVLLMAQYVVILVLQGPFLLIGRLVSGGMGATTPIWIEVLQGVSGACGNALGGPFLTIGVALIHRDARAERPTAPAG